MEGPASASASTFAPTSTGTPRKCRNVQPAVVVTVGIIAIFVVNFVVIVVSRFAIFIVVVVVVVIIITFTVVVIVTGLPHCSNYALSGIYLLELLFNSI